MCLKRGMATQTYMWAMEYKVARKWHTPKVHITQPGQASRTLLIQESKQQNDAYSRC